MNIEHIHLSVVPQPDCTSMHLTMITSAVRAVGFTVVSAAKRRI